MSNKNQMTLVKIVQQVLFVGDVSDYVLDNFNHQFHSDVGLVNEDEDEIWGELIEGYMESVIVMDHHEENDKECLSKNPPIHYSQVFVHNAKGNLKIDDLIQLDGKQGDVYMIIVVGDYYMLSNCATRKSMYENEQLTSLSMMEAYLKNHHPEHIVLTKGYNLKNEKS